MNAQDVINAWRDYKLETGLDITLAEFRKIMFESHHNKEERHPGRSLEQCVFDKDYGSHHELPNLMTMESQESQDLEGLRWDDE